MFKQKSYEMLATGKSWWGHIKPYLALALKAILAFYGVILLLIILFRFVNPPTSAVMVWERFKGHDVHHYWVPMDDINFTIPRAVMTSEDGQFCNHNGVDWRSMRLAFNKWRAGSKKPAGASTLAMQTAKNLFLWQGRSYVRKMAEIPIAYMMVAVWPRKRLMEVYLNIAQWGDGVYGVGMASSHHFNKAPFDVSAHEASLLAASLPNPMVRTAGRPGPKTRRLSRIIAKRANHSRPWTGCLRN